MAKRLKLSSTSSRRTRAKLPSQPQPAAPSAQLKPRWDAQEHKLWYGKVLVHHFTRPAKIVELILTKFEELAWPEWIANPLHPPPYTRPSVHLRGTVENLNRRLKNSPIKFGTIGQGKAVCWRLAQ